METQGKCGLAHAADRCLHRIGRWAHVLLRNGDGAVPHELHYSERVRARLAQARLVLHAQDLDRPMSERNLWNTPRTQLEYPGAALKATLKTTQDTPQDYPWPKDGPTR